MKCAPFIYSQAPAVDSLPISSSDTRQLPLLSGIDTAAKSCESEPQRDGSPACTCTRETFGCSIHPNTPVEWIASQRASLARTLARPEIVQVLRKVRAAVCGPKSSALLASFDHVTCSLKTSQQSLVSDSIPCSPILPSWGSMLAGAVYELPTLERLIDETDGGFWPTATVLDSKNRTYYSKGDLALSGAVLWPTPTVVTDTGGAALCKWGGSGSRKKFKTMVTPAELNGALNPTWVEWLMGWPLAWTVSKHWATVKRQSKQRSRGES